MKNKKIIKRILATLITVVIVMAFPAKAYAASNDATLTVEITSADGQKNSKEHKVTGKPTDVKLTAENYIKDYCKQLVENSYLKIELSCDEEELEITYGEPNSTSDNMLLINSAENSDIRNAMNNDPDIKEFCNAIVEEWADGSSTTAEGIFEGFVDWILKMCGLTLDLIVFNFAEEFGPNIGIYEGENISFISTMVPTELLKQTEVAFTSIGWTLLILLTLAALIFSMLEGLTTYQEHPVSIFVKTLVAGVAVLWIRPVLQYLFQITWGLMGELNIIETNVSGEGISSLLLSDESNLTSLLQLVLVVMILWNIFKLMLEVIERYFVLALMYYIAPVAAATMGNSLTSNVAIQYFKMLVSHLFIMIMNLWFFQLIAAVIENGEIYLEANSSVMSSLFFYFGLLAIIQMAQRIDDYMSNIGLSVARTGHMLAGAAGGAITGLYTMKNVAKAGMGIAGGVKSIGTKTVQKTMGIDSKTGTLDTIKQATGKNNIIDANKNVIPGKSNPNALKDFSKMSNGTMDANSLRNLPLSVGKDKYNVPSGHMLSDASMLKAKGGMAEGVAIFDRKDPTTGKVLDSYAMNISTHKTPGAKTLLEPDAGGIGLYATPQKGTIAGGLPFKAGDEASKSVASIAYETGNFTKQDMVGVGFSAKDYDSMQMRPSLSNDHVYEVYTLDNGKEEILGTVGIGEGNYYSEMGNQICGNPLRETADYDAMSASTIINEVYNKPDVTITNVDDGFMEFSNKNENVFVKDPSRFAKQKGDDEIIVDDKVWYVEKTRETKPSGKRFFAKGKTKE